MKRRAEAVMRLLASVAASGAGLFVVFGPVEGSHTGGLALALIGAAGIGGAVNELSRSNNDED